MLSRVLETIKNYSMIKPGDNLVVAVSGGPDSVALLYCLYSLRDKLGIDKLIVGHLNHMFRGKEAEEEALFVKNFAKNLELPVVTAKADVPRLIKKTGLSPQDAARRERYRFLYSLAEKHNAKIAVGQHADDQAETVLMHILQGTGSEGLAGMEPVSGKIIRPLLYIRRREIELFLKEKKLPYRLDPSNYKEIYLRNKIRLKLLPLIKKEYNPNVVENLLHTSEIIRAENNFLDEKAREIFLSIKLDQEEGKIAFLLEDFNSQHLAIRRRIIRISFRQLADQGDIAFKHVTAVLALAEKSQVGSVVNLPFGIEARKDYDKLIIGKFTESEEKDINFFCFLPVPGSTHLKRTNEVLHAEILDRSNIENMEDPSLFSGKGKTVLVDLKKVSGRLYVRNRRSGDHFIPFGMKGTKKLKDFFIDEKVPKERRDRLPLVVCGEDGSKILWVTGMRINEQFRVDESTTKVLKLSLTDHIGNKSFLR